MSKKIRTLGNFEQRAQRDVKPKFCKNCGRPVHETVGNLGYCKKCIGEERERQIGV